MSEYGHWEGECPHEPQYGKTATKTKYSPRATTTLHLLLHYRAKRSATTPPGSRGRSPSRPIQPVFIIATTIRPEWDHAMKLEQGQIWKTHPDVHSHGGNPLYLRIVQLERLSVSYKEISDLKTGDGTHKQATKKQFCRMIRQGELVS